MSLARSPCVGFAEAAAAWLPKRLMLIVGVLGVVVDVDKPEGCFGLLVCLFHVFQPP